jgi:hypothetical protein
MYSGGYAEYRLPPAIVFEPFRLRNGVDLIRGCCRILNRGGALMARRAWTAGSQIRNLTVHI